MDYIPEHLKESIDLYVSKGIPTGGFLEAVLSNDLAGAIGKADVVSMANLKGIVSYVYNEIPYTAWGSKEKVNCWLRRFHEEKIE